MKKTKEKIMRRGRPKTRVGNNYCADCKIEMKEVFYVRTMPKLCSDCKGEAWAANSEVKKLYKDAIANPTEPAEDEMFFEDDPRAETEQLYGKVSKTPNRSNYATESCLNEVIM
jgi:Zn-finger nucleic acid-binding protein